jgi:hypothetical protein
VSRGKQYSDLLVAQYADGAAIANSTTETRLQHVSGRFTLPASYFDQIGKTLELDMWGRISNIVTTPGTLTLRVKFGSTVTTGTGAVTGGVSVWDSGAIALNTTAKTNVSFRLKLLLTAQVLGDGALAKLMGMGEFTTESLSGASAGQPLDLFLPGSAPAQGTGFDANAAQSVDVSAQWSIANAGNSIQSHLYNVKGLN